MTEKLTTEQLAEIRHALEVHETMTDDIVKLLAHTKALTAERDKARRELDELQDQNAMTESNFDDFAEDSLDQIDDLTAERDQARDERDATLRFATATGPLYDAEPGDAPQDEQQHLVRLMHGEAAVRPGGDQHLDHLLNPAGGAQ